MARTLTAESFSSRPQGRAHAIPAVANALLVGGMVALYGYALFVLPLLLVHSLWWAATLIPLSLLHSVHWGLIHEAIHQHLFADRQANHWGGRVLSWLFGAAFPILSFGHLMHHQWNREWQSEQVQKVDRKSRVHYYYTLLGGLYFTEVTTSFMMAMLSKERFMISMRPTLSDAAMVAGERYFYERNKSAEVRGDVICSVLLYGAAFVIYGKYALVLLAFLLVRATWISLMDNIYHYGTEEKNPGKNLAVSPLLSPLLLNANYHEVHHVHATMPWNHLARFHHDTRSAFDGRFWEHMRLQFNGPIEVEARGQ